MICHHCKAKSTTTIIDYTHEPEMRLSVCDACCEQHHNTKVIRGHHTVTYRMIKPEAVTREK